MNKFTPTKALVQTLCAALIAALTVGGLAPALYSAETKTAADAPTNSVATTASAPATAVAKAKRQLTGAELYSIHCNRCHPERYPTERTAAQWKTIMLHMQVRANLPGNQSRQILKYLQENSGR